MKTMRIVPVYIAMALLTVMSACSQATDSKKTANKGFAVLELFTSEGCSSCPPADALMGQIQQDYKDKDVYVLSYHVDYWDNQGWKDVFGNHDYTKRQYQYGSWLGVDPVYTPQLVVNGKAQLIGSQESEVKAAMQKALLTSSSSTAKLSLNGQQQQGSLTVNYTTNAASKNNRLLIAVVQKSAQTNVKRGENGGRILKHYQIVRHLHTAAITKEGKGNIKLQLPENFNTKDFEVVGFIQDIATGGILGVTRASL